MWAITLIIGGVICVIIIIWVIMKIREEHEFEAFLEESRIQSMAEHAGFPDGDWVIEDFEEIAQKAGFDNPGEWHLATLDARLADLEAELQRIESITPEDMLREIELDEAEKAAAMGNSKAEVYRLKQLLAETERALVEVKEKALQGAEMRDKSTVVQNITYNIKDSSIVADEFGTTIGKKDD